MPLFKSKEQALIPSLSYNLVKNSNFMRTSLNTTKKVIPGFTKSLDYILAGIVSIGLYQLYLISNN
jgi:hypothetical protein|tara:strand:+ start:377 stop:574 length:198 start_codon:yes stop_codon:yes gene_type:complete